MDEPKPQTEVTEETRETLHLLELERTPRLEKLRQERAFFDGAHEVRFTERTFRPRAGASLDEVRTFVDSLEARKRVVPPLPVPTQPAPVSVPPQVPEHYRAPLEAVVPGSLLSVETVHRVGTGTVVDVAWENEAEGMQRGLYVITDEGARPYDNVASKIDELPPPPPPAAPATPSAEPVEIVLPPTPPEKKRMFSFGKKKDKPAQAAPPAEEPKKRRFGSGKR